MTDALKIVREKIAELRKYVEPPRLSRSEKAIEALTDALEALTVEVARLAERVKEDDEVAALAENLDPFSD
jgi:histone H3/H4